MLSLPTGGSSQNVRREHHGAALYLVFSSREVPERNTTIGYVWDNAFPVGEILTRPGNPSVHYVVVQSGPDQLNTWLTEVRNVFADYLRIYREEPSILKGMFLVVDSDQTDSKAGSLFGPISFSHQSQLAKGEQDPEGEDSQASTRIDYWGHFSCIWD